VQVSPGTNPTPTPSGASRLSAYLGNGIMILYHPRVQLVQPHRNVVLSGPLSARSFGSSFLWLWATVNNNNRFQYSKPYVTTIVYLFIYDLFIYSRLTSVSHNGYVDTIKPSSIAEMQNHQNNGKEDKG
jgi:hypothetical protein